MEIGQRQLQEGISELQESMTKLDEVLERIFVQGDRYHMK